MTVQTPLSPAASESLVSIRERLRDQVSDVEWPLIAPLITDIQRLKAERNAIVLAHNYMRPEIFHGVADIVGDSLALARLAAETDAQVIVMAGVHFMAETAKILCPEKTVLMPDMRAGCSLAESITGADVRAMKAKYPGVPVVVYVNTSAEVKAEADVCCTSGNALKVVESLGVDRVLFLPDRYLAANVATQTAVEIIPWEPGACEVHEQYSPQDIADIRDAYDHEITVIAHPECPPEVLQAADFSGSTAQMADYVRDHAPKRVLLVTECSMGDNLAASAPDTEFVRSCNLCPHMRRITLENIKASLETMAPAIEIDPDLSARARRSVDRMLSIGR